jgi:tetratricopeptide (TPR) repeat protein
MQRADFGGPVNDGAVSLQDLIRRRQAAGFVGRQGELSQFAANLEVPVQDPRRRFVFRIHGDGGVGKTFLLRQLQRIAAEHGAIGAYVDEAIFSAPDAMTEIATQLNSRGVAMKDFLRLAENYRQRRGEVEADPLAPTGIASLMTRTATRIGVEALRSVPAVGALAAVVDGDALADQADQLRKFLGAKLRHEDVRMLLSPVEALTPTFVRELAAGSRERPLTLFIDTYERTGPFLNGWLLELLEGRYGQLPAEIVITIAGRDPVDQSGWSPYLSVMADMPMVPFDDADARQLLGGKAITDERVIEVILRLSGGLPLLVAMLAEHQPADAAAVGDPTGDAVERFLKWESDPARRSLALAAALPRSVNEDVLGQLIEAQADSRQEFTWLQRLSFVSRQAGHCQYHSVVRSAMLRLEHGQSPARWSATHRQLGTYYRSLRISRSATDAWDDATWRDHRLEESYHELCAESARALPEALAGVVYALGEGTSISAAWIQAIKQAGADSDSAAVRQWGDRLTQAQADAEDNGLATVDLLLREADLDRPAKSEAHRIRGRRHRQRGRYEEALADFNHALELNPDESLAAYGRGETYLLMRRHEQALADFNRAIELDPDDTWTLVSRGQTYWLLGRYQEALTDLNRALELKPNDFAATANRGYTYRLLRQYEEALTDFNRTIELHPDSVWTRVVRGETYRLVERHEEALADLDRAVELEPGNAWATANRGEAHRLTGRYEEALADFDRAIELDPDADWAICRRGETYRLTDRHEEALTDFNRAIELTPDYAWALGSRGQTYRAMERYEDALTDLNHALELKPEYEWAIRSRGQTYRAMGRYEEALTDFNRALELNPNDDWAICNRGETYRLMDRYDEALTDFNHVLELDPDYTWALAIRGRTYCVKEQYEDALTDLARAIELNPEYDWAIGNRGEVYRLTGRYDEALTDFNRAIELNPKYDWAIGSRGQTYRTMGRYEDALTDLARAIELDPTNAWTHYSAALVHVFLADEAKAAEHLNIAISLCELDDAATARGDLVICRIAQHNELGARQLISEFINSSPSHYQLRELAVDLAELAEIPGMDQVLIEETLALIASTDPEN